MNAWKKASNLTRASSWNDPPEQEVAIKGYFTNLENRISSNIWKITCTLVGQWGCDHNRSKVAKHSRRQFYLSITVTSQHELKKRNGTINSQQVGTFIKQW